MCDDLILTVRCLPLEEWPQEDRRGWERAQRDDDLLEEEGLFARLRPSTLSVLESSYGRWLHHLATYDAAALALDPAARITGERVAAYVVELHQLNASTTVANRILGLERAALAFAPGGNWRWLRTLVNKLTQRAKPMRDKRARLLPPQDVFRAALDHMGAAETGTFTSAKKQASAYRNGLVLGVAAARAVRIGNLGMVEIGKHLRRSGEGWRLHFDATETKNHDVSELPLPDELTKLIERYLDQWRPVLLDGHSSDRLWISSSGRPIDGEGLYSIVTQCTERLLGVKINPHALRAGLLTEIAIRDPAHVGIGAAILGHRASATGTKHYNLARQHEAAREWQQLTLDLRTRARQRRSKRDDKRGHLREILD